MHPAVLKKLIANCHARIAGGDHPTRPPDPIELLEDAVAELDNRSACAFAALKQVNEIIRAALTKAGSES